MSRWGIDPVWEEIFQPQAALLDHLLDSHKENDLPAKDVILRAFTKSPQEFNAVIVGQDPYPTPGHAQGLAFSVAKDVHVLPASLRNIFKEYVEDTGYPTPTSGDLSAWFERGVLLLNRTLTVSPHDAGSHQGRGWETITSHALERLAMMKPGLVAILWGNHAQTVDSLFQNVIKSAHPSPLAAHRGFFGSRPFTRTNELLRAEGLTEIEWRLP